MHTPDPRPTLHNLQALRGVACLLVFGIHLAIWESHYGIARPLLTPLLWVGYAGVDLFFVLSGFLIAFTQADSLGRAARLPGYLFRRAWRIYPTYWAMMLFTLLLYEALNAVPPLTPDPGRGVRWLTWLTLWPAVAPNVYVIVSWTLPFEVMFYIAFGLLLLLPRRFAAVLLIGWAALVGVVALTTGWLHFSPLAVVQHAVSPHVWEFLLGCGVASVLRAGVTRFAWPAVLLGVAWAAAWIPAFNTAAMPYAVGSDPVWRVFTFGPAAALIAYGLAAVERRGGRVLPKWLRRTGDASYSIYLWHTPVGMLFHDWSAHWWNHTLWPHVAWIAAMTALCVGGGLLFHRWLEKPLLNLGKRKREPQPTVFAATIRSSPLPSASASAMMAASRQSPSPETPRCPQHFPAAMSSASALRPPSA